MLSTCYMSCTNSPSPLISLPEVIVLLICSVLVVIILLQYLVLKVKVLLLYSVPVVIIFLLCSVIERSEHMFSTCSDSHAPAPLLYTNKRTK